MGNWPSEIIVDPNWNRSEVRYTPPDNTMKTNAPATNLSGPKRSDITEPYCRCHGLPEPNCPLRRSERDAASKK